MHVIPVSDSGSFRHDMDQPVLISVHEAAAALGITIARATGTHEVPMPHLYCR
jgi:hypothetical protein